MTASHPLSPRQIRRSRACGGSGPGIRGGSGLGRRHGACCRQRTSCRPTTAPPSTPRPSCPCKCCSSGMVRVLGWPLAPAAAPFPAGTATHISNPRRTRPKSPSPLLSPPLPSYKPSLTSPAILLSPRCMAHVWREQRGRAQWEQGRPIAVGVSVPTGYPAGCRHRGVLAAGCQSGARDVRGREGDTLPPWPRCLARLPLCQGVWQCMCVPVCVCACVWSGI